MTVLTNETKAQKMRDALAKLAGEYMTENRLKEAQGVLAAQIELNASAFRSVGAGDKFNESLARLYDIIVAS